MWRSKQLLSAGTKSLKVLKQTATMVYQAYFYESDMYTLGREQCMTDLQSVHIVMM